MGFPGGIEWLVVLVIVLVIFGGKKIPELMGGLGKGIRSFKKGMSSDESEASDDKLLDEKKNKANGQE